MAKSRVKRASKKKPLALPTFLPGMRGSAEWHQRAAKQGETPHTLNHMGGAGEFVIPTGGTKDDELVKLHELLHAAHSPVEPPRDIVVTDGRIVHVDNLLIAEEVRINTLCRMMVGWEELPDPRPRDAQVIPIMVKTIAVSQAAVDVIQFLKWMLIAWPLQDKELEVEFHGTEIAYDLVRNHQELRDQGLLEIVYLAEDMISKMANEVWFTEFRQTLIDGQIPSWDSVIALAAWLEQEFDNIQQLMSAPEGDSSPGMDEDGDQADPDLQKLLHGQSQEVQIPGGGDAQRPIKRLSSRVNTMDMLQKRAEDPMYTDDESEPIWGRMTTRIAKMTKSLPKKLVSRSKWGASDEGTVPRYIHRMPIDGKIFGRKKKEPGGSVLIDDSGSMSFSTQDIREIMEAAPAVNIAAYSGQSSKGELVILGQDGKYAEINNMTRPKGSNNLVDLPALEWLAEQPKPRIWVSDTKITLVDGDIRKAYKQVYRICKQKDINIVPNAYTAKRVFEGKHEIYR